MRYFQIHLKDPVGNRIDYWTGEKHLKDLIAKYDIVIDYLKKAGFEQVADVSPSPQNVPQSTTGGQERLLCSQCQSPMIYKEGVRKTGKSWKGWFCAKDKTHTPQWVK